MRYERDDPLEFDYDMEKKEPGKWRHMDENEANPGRRFFLRLPNDEYDLACARLKERKEKFQYEYEDASLS